MIIRLRLLIICLLVNFTVWPVTFGDVTGDERVDVEDVNAIICIILKEKSINDFFGNADVDNNAVIDVKDLNLIINEILTRGVPTGRKVGMGDGRDSIYLQQILNCGLEVLDIELNDGVWPTAEYVSSPQGAWGRTIANPTKVPGRMRILLRNNILYDSDEYIEDKSGMTLRIRGNTSAWHDKKPYKIKLQKKADLLLRDSIDGKDKDWLLIYDETLHYMLGFEVGRLLGMTWTPGYRYVNVIINNQYEGFYMLLESVKRNTSSRINISKHGYIFEHDQYWWNEQLWLPSISKYPYKYTFKYPDFEDFTDIDSTYMTNLIHDMELSFTNDNYPEVIDVHSFALFCLAHDILGTQNYGSNRYYIKKDRSDTTLVEMPLLWDFDRADGDLQDWSLTHRVFFNQFFQNTNRTFVEEFSKLWNQVSPNLYNQIDSIMKNTEKSTGSAISWSLNYDKIRWGTHRPTNTNFLNRSNWIKKRIPWIDLEISRLPK